jgi:hypothetical protein
MSGAAAIAAAKNRRGRAETNQKQLPPPVSCGRPPSSSQNKVVPANKPSPATNKVVSPQSSVDLFDPNTLQILGPLPPAQILRLHEQRLNKLDEKCATNVCATNEFNTNNVEETAEDLTPELFGRIGTLESKLAMLEEVIMTLQNKLTIAQNFAMETSMSVANVAKEQQQFKLSVETQALNQTQSLNQTQALVQSHVQVLVDIQTQALVQAQSLSELQLNLQSTRETAIDVTTTPVETPSSPTEAVAEPVVVLAEPVVVLAAEPVVVLAEPVVVLAEPVVVLAEPVVVLAEPAAAVVVAEPTTLTENISIVVIEQPLNESA